MQINIEVIKQWFSERSARERGACLLLSLVFWVTLFDVLCFHPLKDTKAGLEKSLTAVLTESNAWQTQLSTLKTIAASPLYQEWNRNQQRYLKLRGDFQQLLTARIPSYWENIIRTILKSHSKVILEQISSQDESLFEPLQSTTLSTLIYQQPLQVVVVSDYFDTISYLKIIEAALPNIHWDKLTYQVTEYPNARINMEFSILYEKSA